MGMRVWGSANYPYNPGAGYVLKLLSRAPHEPSASADVSQFKKSYRRAGGHTGRQAGRRHAVDKTAISRAARHRAASGNWVSGMIFSHGWCLSMVAPPALSTSSLSSPPTPALPFARHLLPTPPVNFEQDKWGGGRRIHVPDAGLLNLRSCGSGGGSRNCRAVASSSSSSSSRESENSVRGGSRGSGDEGGRRNCTVMLMDVAAEASGGSARAPARWGAPLAVTIEALVLLLVTAVLVQVRFSHLMPKLVHVLSSGCAFLLHKPPPHVDTPDKKRPAARRKSYEAAEFNVPSLDDESARRRTRSTYQTRIYDILGIVPDEDVRGLTIAEKYEMNSRNVEIFSKSWIPQTGEVKAAICFCHGYGDTCTFFFEGIARKLAAENFAVFAMDYRGFGLSQGLHGYIPCFDLLVDDVCEHYSLLKMQEEFNELPFYLMGESMGGAVALKAQFRMPATWDGAVLIAPMCKIAEEMYPPWYLLKILKFLARIIPKAKLVPSGDIAEIGFQDVKKRQQAMQNIIAYVGKPRLGTALSLLKATDQIEQQLDKVSLPILILHGAEDRVTDPAVSKALYERSCSQDKTLHLYENSWHAVLEGESDEAVDKAIADIVIWLDSRCPKTIDN